MELGLAFLLVLALADAGSLSLSPLSGAGRSGEAGASPAASSEGGLKERGMAAGVQAPHPSSSGQEQGPGPVGVPRPRDRRCTCFTYKDKECVYYCHLDIIWINTPERTVPYGLSNPSASFRGRRASGLSPQSLPPAQQAQRCTCMDDQDWACVSFCTWTPAASRNTRGTDDPSERRKARHEREKESRTEEASRV